MRNKIIADAMGSDNGLESFVKGAVDGAREAQADLLLVGDKERIDRTLTDCDTKGIGIEIEDVKEEILMTDAPGAVMKEKANCSMAVAVRLLKEGRGDALISCGNTGALFTAASLIVRRIKGVRRAMLAAVVPLNNPFLICDAGANPDANAQMLVQFAIMGSIYHKLLLGTENPRVALLNNGAESTKGTPLQQESYNLLKDSNLNFIGNCEGRDLAFDFCDVVTCDGFVGNITLKTIEGMGKFTSSLIKKIFKKSIITKMGYLFTHGSVRRVKKQLSPSEYGGAPFLGINGIVIKAHGASDSKSIAKTVIQASSCVDMKLVECIENGIAEYKEALGANPENA